MESHHFLQWESNPSVSLQSGVIPARINWRVKARWLMKLSTSEDYNRNAWIKNPCRMKKEMERNDFTKNLESNRTNVHISCTHRGRCTSPSYQWNWYRIRTCSAIDILGLCLNTLKLSGFRVFFSEKKKILIRIILKQIIDVVSLSTYYFNNKFWEETVS